MRALVLRGFTVVALTLVVAAGHAPRASAQAPGPRPLVVEPVPPTLIESLLATPIWCSSPITTASTCDSARTCGSTP